MGLKGCCLKKHVTTGKPADARLGALMGMGGGLSDSGVQPGFKLGEGV